MPPSAGSKFLEGRKGAFCIRLVLHMSGKMVASRALCSWSRLLALAWTATPPHLPFLMSQVSKYHSTSPSSVWIPKIPRSPSSHPYDYYLVNVIMKHFPLYHYCQILLALWSPFSSGSLSVVSHPTIHPSIYPFIHLSIQLSIICPSMHPYFQPTFIEYLLCAGSPKRQRCVYSS